MTLGTAPAKTATKKKTRQPRVIRPTQQAPSSSIEDDTYFPRPLPPTHNTSQSLFALNVEYSDLCRDQTFFEMFSGVLLS